MVTVMRGHASWCTNGSSSEGCRGCAGESYQLTLGDVREQFGLLVDEDLVDMDTIWPEDIVRDGDVLDEDDLDDDDDADDAHAD